MKEGIKTYFKTPINPRGESRTRSPNSHKCHTASKDLLPFLLPPPPLCREVGGIHYQVLKPYWGQQVTARGNGVKAKSSTLDPTEEGLDTAIQGMT